MAKIQVYTVVSAPFEENSYVVWREGHSAAVVVDPGLEPGLILDFLFEQELTPVALLCTHGHADHIGGNAAIKTSYPEIPLWIGEKDAPMLTDPELNLSGPFGFPMTSPPATRLLREGDRLEVAHLVFTVRDLPGHSPGHVVFLLEDGSQTLVFGGDTLMRGAVGRGDFPGGDFAQLLQGIRQVLYTLPPATVVYPGHGPVTTVGHERTTNPSVPDAPR